MSLVCCYELNISKTIAALMSDIICLGNTNMISQINTTDVYKVKKV